MNRSPDLDRDFAAFCRTADPEALGRVFDATAAHLLRIAAWLCGNRADAEDAVQRAFLVAIEQRASFRRGRPALPWLVGLLTNQVHKVRRERARRAAPAIAPAAEHDPAVCAAGAELEQALAGAVSSLGASYHDVLHLHLREGLAAHEIAQRLGRPAGTVRTQIVRGVQELRRRLPSGFTGAFAPAWRGNGPFAPGASVRDAVLASARAQHVAVAGGTWLASRPPLLVAVLGAVVAIGIGLSWWLPARSGHAAAALETASVADRVRADQDAPATPEAPGATAARATRPDETMLREAVAADPASRANEDLSVRVTDAANIALAGARVCLCDSTWRKDATQRTALRTASSIRVAFVAAATDARGFARFAAPASELDTILVVANGRRPVQVARAVAAVEQDVLVDQHLSISGTVVVDGGRPGEPIDLVAADGTPSGAWCAAVLAALAPFDPGEVVGAATCDESGRFMFFGLANGTEYTIRPRVDAYKEPGTQRTPPAVKATPLAVGVVLELARVPVIRGRPVLPPGVAAAGRERVWVHRSFVRRNGDSYQWGGFPCLVGEQFSVPVDDADLATASIDLRFGPGKANPIVATRTVACPFEGVHDLGDVVCNDPASEREVLVVDRQNAPIAGARVLSIGKLSEPGGADGRVRTLVAPAPSQLVVGARGYRARQVDAGDDATQPVVVVLDAANRLRVERRAAPGVPHVAPMRVDLVFADRPDGPDLGDDFAVAELRGAKLTMASASADEETLHFELPASGTFELWDLPPGVVFTAQLCDAYGHVIAAETITMRADEHRDVRFVVAQAPRRLAGQVVDADGRPLRGVTVSVGPFDNDPRSTDVDGRFQVDGVYGDSPCLVFKHDGFRQLILQGAELFERTTYRLERAD